MKYIAAIFLSILLFLNGCGSKNKNEEISELNITRIIAFYNMLDASLMRNSYRNNLFYEEFFLEKKDSSNQKKFSELRTRTNIIIKRIGFAKYTLFESIGGGLDKDKFFIKNIFANQKVEEFMLGTKEDGKIYELLPLIEEHIVYLNQNFKEFSTVPFISPTKLTNEMNPLFENNEEYRKYGFAETYFKDSPNILALTMLVDLQNHLLLYEADIQENYRQKMKGKL